MALKICVTGGRDFNDKDFIVKTLSKFVGQNIILAHGGASGVDEISAEFACQQGWPVIEYKADWKKYGNSAGPIRNEEMLFKFKPHMLIAFPGGKGTLNCINNAKSKEILIVYASNERKNQKEE